MSRWLEESRNDILNQCMDVCANVDKFRQVIILTMTNKGKMGVVQHSNDSVTSIERLGMYRLMLKDTESQILDCFEGNSRPNQED